MVQCNARLFWTILAYACFAFLACPKSQADGFDTLPGSTQFPFNIETSEQMRLTTNGLQIGQNQNSPTINLKEDGTTITGTVTLTGNNGQSNTLSVGGNLNTVTLIASHGIKVGNTNLCNTPGVLVYHPSDAHFYVCNGSSWQPLLNFSH